jgi:amidohydrolase
MGVDPITVSAQLITALQTIPSRQVDVTAVPTVISVGSIHGGVRGNIIPDEVELVGTIRTFDEEIQGQVHRRIRRTAEAVAQSAGATAEVAIDRGYPVTINDPELTQRMLPALERVVGEGNLLEVPVITGAEDFSFFAREAPGFYFFLGVRTPGTSLDETAPNHSPHFFVDERALPVGVRALAQVAVSYLTGGDA